MRLTAPLPCAVMCYGRNKPLPPKALRAGAGSGVAAPVRPKPPRSGARLVLGQRPAARCRSLPLNIIPLPGGNFNALYTSEAIKKENVLLKTSPQNFSTQGCGKGGRGINLSRLSTLKLEWSTPHPPLQVRAITLPNSLRTPV